MKEKIMKLNVTIEWNRIVYNRFKENRMQCSIVQNKIQ